MPAAWNLRVSLAWCEEPRSLKAPFDSTVFSKYSENSTVFRITKVLITMSCLVTIKNYVFNTAVFTKPCISSVLKKEPRTSFLKTEQPKETPRCYLLPCSKSLGGIFAKPILRVAFLRSPMSKVANFQFSRNFSIKKSRRNISTCDLVSKASSRRTFYVKTFYESERRFKL